jgi:hypothetical protein
MAKIQKPPETVKRQIRLEASVSQLLDDYSRFVERTPTYVVNFALRKTLARDREYKRWKASQTDVPPGEASSDSTDVGRSV